MKAAIYLRVSSEEQRERQTILTQRNLAERYCILNEITIYSWYADDGVSGTIPLDQRPEGLRLIQDAKDSKFDTIYIYRIDRLGRDPRLILNAVNDLELLGVQVKSMTEPFDTTSPSGRFLLTTLSGVAGFERDVLIQRSIEGTNRLAREGVWLGGIVTYGYQVVGKSKDSRLVVSEQHIPGFLLSEADVVRLIYRLTVEEHKSCLAIADHLNALGIPPTYVRDGREVTRGKRKATTSGIWRAGRIRNMIVNSTYKGIHQYGRRTNKQREIIEREVPAIVSVDTWAQAQVVLHEHMLFSDRNATRSYLLRGIIKCGLCGLTFIGTAHPTYKDKSIDHSYYVCNGKHQARGIYGAQGKKCPSKAVNGEVLEAAVWQDIESFLLNPGDVLEKMAARMRSQAGETERLRNEIAGHQQTLLTKIAEKDTVITLFRRGRIDDRALDRQLDQIQQEEAGLEALIGQLQEQISSVQVIEQSLRSAEGMLQSLCQRLGEEPLTWKLKRQLVETLVERICVETFENEAGKKETKTTVTYRFGASTATGTGKDSWPPQA